MPKTVGQSILKRVMFTLSMLRGIKGHFSPSLRKYYGMRGGSTCTNSVSGRQYDRRVFLAVGSNLGDRFANIYNAIDILCENEQAKLVQTSFLHETEPMYVEDQPSFLNGAVTIETNLDPHELLREIKIVEQKLGRDFDEIRNGPRKVDLDILVYQTRRQGQWESDPTLNTDNLIIPHPRIEERSFVLTPLMELVGQDFQLPQANGCLSEIKKKLETGGPITRVLPLKRGRLLRFNETIVMGILNVTPDSFSDGGKWTASLRASVKRALEMQRQGALIIDIGGESTRPGADEVHIEEEIKRTIPCIQAIRRESDIAISIDTRHSAVARAAIQAGADIVNDVSGGTTDPDMFTTVADLGVPMIIMHMRGTPKTMQSMTDYIDVVKEVGESLARLSKAARKAGIHRWLQVVDPGIGFAKDLSGNLLLLKRLSEIRDHTFNLPLLIGTSRKGFIGKITGVDAPEDRDFGTVASCVAALASGDQLRSSCNADIVRAHNVEATKNAIDVLDAIKRAS